MKKAGEVWSIKGMNQEQFNIQAQKMIDNARSDSDKIRCILEKEGGACPSCGELFRVKHNTKMGSDYIYYTPYCSCFEEKRIKLTDLERGMIRAGIPSKFWDKEFDSLRMDLIKPETVTAFNSARDYCINRHYEAEYTKAGIVLWGDVGSGKTLSSVLIAKELIKAGKRGVFLEVPEFINSITDKEKADFISRVKGKDFVILDDLTKKTIPSGWMSDFHSFLNYLDNNKILTIITDERQPGELQKIFIPSIYSRLSLLVGAHIIKFSGADFRKKEREL